MKTLPLEKIMLYSITVFFFCLVGCLLDAPKLEHTEDGAKLSTVETQNIFTQSDLDVYIIELMESQGWEKPDLETEEEIADRWLMIMTWSAGIAVVCLLVWYGSHLREFGGFAMILGCVSLISGGLAATADYFWIVGVGVMILIVCSVLGFLIKDWHVIPSKRTKKV